LAVDLGAEVRIGVHPRLLLAPVEVALPVLDHRPEVGLRRPVVPGVLRGRRGEAGPGEPRAQVAEVGLGDVDAERGDLHCGPSFGGSDRNDAREGSGTVVSVIAPRVGDMKATSARLLTLLGL